MFLFMFLVEQKYNHILADYIKEALGFNTKSDVIYEKYDF